MMTLNKLDRLLDKWRQRGVRFCHWKSNRTLRYETGEELDILVAPDDLQAARDVLVSLGFLPARAHHSERVDPSTHWIGVDGDLAQVMHIHLYARIVTGGALAKSHYVDVHDQLLAAAVHPSHGLPISDRTMEWALLVLRKSLEAQFLPERVMLRRELPAVCADLDFLAADGQITESRFNEKLPFWSGHYGDFLRAASDLQAGRLRAAGKNGVYLERTLNRLAVGPKYRAYRFLRLGALLWARIKGRPYRTRLLNGAMVIAVVGVDGAGKSTLATAVAERFAKHVETEHLHIGKPPATLLTACSRPLIRLGRLATSSTERQVDHQKPAGTIRLVRELVLAKERRQLAKAAFRVARRGRVVIVDRWPTTTPGGMDGPPVPSRSSVNDAIHRAITKTYEAIEIPSMCIRLKCDIGTLLSRHALREDRANAESPQSLTTRLRLMDQWTTIAPTYVVDCSGSPEEVRASAFTAIDQFLLEGRASGSS